MTDILTLRNPVIGMVQVRDLLHARSLTPRRHRVTVLTLQCPYLLDGNGAGLPRATVQWSAVTARKRR
jgi:hypothetical protein